MGDDTQQVDESKQNDVLPPEAGDESIWAEFATFLREEKKWWLAPLITVLLLLGALIVFAEGSAFAPFIYTIF